MSKQLRRAQRDAYRISRLTGDLNALTTGGVPRLAKRIVRRQVTRRTVGRAWGWVWKI